MYLIKYSNINPIVTTYYLNIIYCALIKKRELVKKGKDWKDFNYKDGDIYVISTATEALYLILLNRPYIFWAQGVWPEESFMRNHSRIRFLLTSFIEKLALVKAKYLFLVSNQMLLHYQKKYKINISSKVYIMPCSNDNLHEEVFSKKDYTKKTFCYAGALSKWQCFEETLMLYKKIEDEYSETSLLLLVKNKEKAINLLKKYKISKYEIDFVPVEELPNRLKDVNFGFLLRKDDIVNTVATPTKLMTYLGNGIIPVYSCALEAVDDMLKQTRYKIRYMNDGRISDIEEFFEKKINNNDIKKEYIEVFDKNFNKENQIDKLSKISL